MDLHLAESTLFLHEDIIVRTLLYEQRLQKWRIEELKAGRGDPGRPSYDTVGWLFQLLSVLKLNYFQVFGGMPTTRHRYHVVREFRAFLRFKDDDDDIGVRYRSANCPGVYDSTSQQEFPVIDTLLSIPFSLLHTIPRLVSMFPISQYQQKLIQFGSEIIRLWWWNPTAKMIAESEKIAVCKKRKHQSDLRDPGPEPIARIPTTFSEFLGLQTTATSTTKSSKRISQNVKLPTLFGTIPLVSLDRDELLFTSADKGSAKLTRSFNGNKGLVATSQVTSASGETAEGAENLVETHKVDGFDIISWSENVVSCGPELLPPLTPSPFHRGVLGGPSVNDILMIKGLIHPVVYIDFLNLSFFTFP